MKIIIAEPAAMLAEPTSQFCCCCFDIFSFPVPGCLLTGREPDTSATRHFGTKFKPNHRWSCVSSELSWVRSVSTFRRSGAEVLRHWCHHTAYDVVLVRSVNAPLTTTTTTTLFTTVDEHGNGTPLPRELNPIHLII